MAHWAEQSSPDTQGRYLCSPQLIGTCKAKHTLAAQDTVSSWDQGTEELSEAPKSNLTGARGGFPHTKKGQGKGVCSLAGDLRGRALLGSVITEG